MIKREKGKFAKKVTDQQILDGYESNDTQGKVAERLDIHRRTVRVRELALGLKGRRRGRPESPKTTDAKEALLIGMTPAEVAKIEGLGISYRRAVTIAHLLEEEGYRIEWTIQRASTGQ